MRENPTSRRQLREGTRPEPSALDTQAFYRLPWTAADNAMTWLEPTRRCNMTCDACFAENDPASDKPLEQIAEELRVLLRERRCDAMLVAGGEPLAHPRIVDVVRMVKESGVKPVLITNGLALDRPLARELRRAGAFGMTFHVDSHQRRPGWLACDEADLNELRGQLADMAHAEGLACAFNVTVFPDTLARVPDIVAWAVRRPDKVQILTLICVRLVEANGPFAFFCGGRPVDLEPTPYAGQSGISYLTTDDLFAQVRSVLPEFDFCAFLGGTVHARSLKWAIGCHLTNGRSSFGVIGARTMELAQTLSHALRGRFLAYTDPRLARRSKASLALALVDRQVRATLGRFLRAAVRRPWIALQPVHMQGISVVQPVDFLPNGEMDTCDGCPNRTFWGGRLVSACRLDEYKRFGAPLHASPRETT